MLILNILGNTLAPKARAVLESLGKVDHKVVDYESLLAIADRYDAIFVGLYPMIDKAVMEKATQLKYIAIPANTIENIDEKYAKKKGIKVISLWGERKFLNTITSTAELALGLMIDIVRFTPWAFDTVKNYKWDRENFRGHTLYEKTLGVVGMGRLGTWMARYGKALGMEVIFYSPHTSKSAVRGCVKVSFDELLKRSDVISLHAHLNDETENTFNAAVFKKMKKTAYLINTARGKIVNEKDLVAALKNGVIAGYAADVLALEFEPTMKLNGYPLVEYAKTHRNVIIVPHTGGMTHESRERTDVFVAEKLRNKLKSKIEK